jgi:hypothetical protein
MAIQTREEFVRGLSGQAQEEAARAASAQIDQIVAQTGMTRKEAALAVYQQKDDWAGQSKNQETDNTSRGNVTAGSVARRSANDPTFNINNFRTELNNFDVLPSHSFLVRFAPFTGTSALNEALTRYTTINKDKLVMRCDNALMPTVSLIKEEAIRRYGYGPTETVPYNVNFGDFTLEWIVDSNSEIIDFFNKWVNVIVNHDSKGGADMSSRANGYAPYEVGFKDDYSNSRVSVFIYDRQLNTTVEYNIFDVFPISIQSLNLSWGNENQMVKYIVTFAFTDMIMKTPRAGLNEVYLQAEQQAAAAQQQAAKPVNEESYKDDIVVTANKNGPNTTARRFGSPFATGGDFTISIPPDVQQNIDQAAAGVPNPKTVNIVTIPSSNP